MAMRFSTGIPGDVWKYGFRGIVGRILRPLVRKLAYPVGKVTQKSADMQIAHLIKVAGHAPVLDPLPATHS
jgi:hypothetical protein